MLDMTDYGDSREVNAWIAVRQIQLRTSSQKDVEIALSGGFRDSGARNESELEGDLSDSEPSRLGASSSTLLDVLRTMYRSQERYASGRSTYFVPFLLFSAFSNRLETSRNIPRMFLVVVPRILYFVSTFGYTA